MAQRPRLNGKVASCWIAFDYEFSGLANRRRLPSGTTMAISRLRSGVLVGAS